MSLHLNLHHSNSECKYTCGEDSCCRKFVNIKSFKAHLHKKHNIADEINGTVVENVPKTTSYIPCAENPADELFNSLLKFVLYLYSLPTMPRSVAVKIIQMVWSMIISSPEETKTSFMMIVKDFSELAVYQSERKSRLAKLNEKETPYITVIGEPLKIQKVYVCVYTQKYEMLTLRDAIDTCMTIFIVFNVKYPAESSHLWNLIQQWFYNIKREKTVYNSSKNSLLKLLGPHV